MASLKQHLVQLRDKGLLSTEAGNTLQVKLKLNFVNKFLQLFLLFQDMASTSLIDDLKCSKIKGKYTPAIRQFAISISFFSNAAYNQLRDIMAVSNIELPSVKTNSKWYQNVNGSPGITKNSLEILRRRVQLAEENKEQLYFTLMMDEMSIRTLQEWDHSKKEFSGFVHFGGGSLDVDLDDEAAMASEVLVFLINGVNCHLKLPIAYFFIKSLDYKERMNIVKYIIKTIYEECKASIIGLTFDGLRANLKMVSALGSSLGNGNKTFFEVPDVPQKFFIFLDNCHMLKLVRNNFKSQGTLIDRQGRQGREKKWNFLEELNILRKQKVLALAPKIRDSDLTFENQKMKVSLAVQLYLA